MNMHIHHLKGCSPVPLAHYLKGLGVLRLIAQQKDPQVRGWWEGESFHILCNLDQSSLCDFFLNEYEPTPLITPWNGGSGFYPKDNKQGITEIRQSTGKRLETYRQSIKLAEAQVGELQESPKKEDKNVMLQRCRQLWQGPLLDWLEAALVLDSNGEPMYPALLGTGGNDGRLDFTNNFMQRLAELFDCSSPNTSAKPHAHSTLMATLFTDAVSNLGSCAVGQFLPGSVGGANSGTGFTGDGLVNPWDFVLMLEGAVAFVSSVSRRANSSALPQAAAPFAVYSSATGFGSATESDKTRGEQWMPLWDRPATFHEIRNLIAEGRSQIGSSPARQPSDFGRAIARLGVSRGITAFERYGYIERNGQANLAVPLGRWEVKSQPHQNLIDDIAPWVNTLQRAGNDKLAPAAIGRAARVCNEAIMACCKGNDTTRWQNLLIALGDAEASLLRSSRFTADKHLKPLPALSTHWLKAIEENTAEYRLAIAFASQFGMKKDGKNPDPIRRHFLPLDDKQERFNCTDDRLIITPEVVCTKPDLQSVAIALVRRRIIEAGQNSQHMFPLQASNHAGAYLGDIAQLLSGQLDEAKILQLIRPMLAFKWPSNVNLPRPNDEQHDSDGIMHLYGLLRLAHWPGELKLSKQQKPYEIRLNPVIFSRLASGYLHSAVDEAARRLRITGLRPHITHAVGNPQMAYRLAMSLAFPINHSNAQRLADRLTRPQVQDDPDATSNLTQKENALP